MLLLNTHTYLWFISDNPLLPQWVSEEIQTSENVFVSIASFWEIAIKNAKGLLDIQVPVSKMMEDCALLNFTVLPINGMHLDKMIFQSLIAEHLKQTIMNYMKRTIRILVRC